MIKLLVEKFINTRVKNKLIREEDAEIYQYGYILLFEMVICIIISLLIAIALRTVLELLVFSIFFIPLRCFGGGFHATKAWRCLAVSTIITFMFCAFIDSTMIVNNVKLLITMSIISCILSQKVITKYNYTEHLSNRVIINLINILGIILEILLYRLCIMEFVASISIAQLIWYGALITRNIYK